LSCAAAVHLQDDELACARQTCVCNGVDQVATRDIRHN